MVHGECGSEWIGGQIECSISSGPAEIKKAGTAGIDLPSILTGKAVPTTEQIAKLNELEVPYHFQTVLGYQINNLYDFFMLFVIMSGIAAMILFVLTRWLGKMMHGLK